MSSRRAKSLVALALLLGLFSACGHRGTPKPPPQRIPAPVRDLTVTQRGNEMLVSFAYPQTTISGLPIDDIASIEVWVYNLPVPEFAAPTSDEDGEDRDDGDEGGEGGEGEDDGEDGTTENGDDADGDSAETEGDQTEGDEEADEVVADQARLDEPEDEGGLDPLDADAAGDEVGDDDSGEVGDTGDTDDTDDTEDDTPAVQRTGEALLEIDPREFVAASKLAKRLEGAELTSAISGDRVQLRIELDGIERDEKEADVYGVKTFQTLKRASAFSNLVTIIPRVTPEPPAALEVEPTGDGVRISYTFEGDDPKEFRFYRREPPVETFGNSLGTQPGDERRFLDSTAEFGKSYAYVMTAVVHREPLVESAFSAEHEFEYLDRFPPGAPTDLVVLPETGLARLLWDESDSGDPVGYLVYRRTGSGEYQRLNLDPVRRTEYSDTTVASGRTYLYRVVGVDADGNESDPSEEVQVRIP